MIVSSTLPSGSLSGIVGVEEGSPVEVEPGRHRAGPDDECGVAGETPLGAHLGPVGAAATDGRGTGPGRCAGASADCRRARPCRGRRRGADPGPGAREADRGGRGARHGVADGLVDAPTKVVESGMSMPRSRSPCRTSGSLSRPATARALSCPGCAGTGATVERRGVGVVDVVAGVAAQHHERREAAGSAPWSEHRFGEERPLLERRPRGRWRDRARMMVGGRSTDVVRVGSRVRAAATGPAIQPAASAMTNGAPAPDLVRACTDEGPGASTILGSSSRAAAAAASASIGRSIALGRTARRGPGSAPRHDPTRVGGRTSPRRRSRRTRACRTGRAASISAA